MTETRISQSDLEALVLPSDRNAIVSQSVVEVLIERIPDPHGRESQSAIEVLTQPTAGLGRVSQSVIEVLMGYLDESPEPPAPPAPPADAECLTVTYSYTGIQVRYYIVLKNQSGDVVALFDNFEALEIVHEVNGVSSYTLTFADNGDTRYDMFELDCQINVYRSIVGLVPWYLEFEGLHRRFIHTIDANGKGIKKSIGFGYNDLLRRTVVAYRAGTIRADKNDYAERVMKEYVEENCGATATTANGRLLNGTLPGFTIAGLSPLYDLTPVWTGSRSGEVLLDVLAAIANACGIDFDVVGNGKAQFLFGTYIGQRGSDRTTVGLDTGNGLNAAGNVPVVFSIDLGNVQSYDRDKDHTSEANAALIWGQGEQSTRTVVPVVNSITMATSPWNRCEVSRPAGSYDTDYETYSLTMYGIELLMSMMAKDVYKWVPMQQPAQLYGYHYYVGDKITFIDPARNSAHKRIIKSTVRVTNSKEEIGFDFADVP